MSLFEKIKNKRYDLQERTKKFPPKDEGSSNNTSNTTTQNQQKNIEKKFGPGKEETKSDKAYTDYVKKKAKDLKTTPAELERSVDRGIRAVDRPAGGRMPSKGYASGEPFQPDNNPRDPKGKYPATGKSTLRGRMKYGLDTKGGDTLPAVKKRLAKRIGYAIKGTREEPRFKTKDDISKFVDKVTKNQPPLSKATGKKSTLYKTLKSYTDAKNPTIPSKAIDRKTGKPQRLPMPEGPKRDAAIKKNLENLDKKIVKASKLPKGVKLPVGGTRTSAPLDPKEFNLQFKADKLKLDYGGRIAERDPKIAGMTAAQKKKNYEKIKARIDKKNPTFKSPVSGGKLPVTPENMKKYKVNKQGFTKGQVFRNAAKKTALKGFNKFKSLGFRGKAGVIGGVALGGYLAYQGAKKLLSPATLTNKDFTSTAPIKDRSGKNVRFKYDKDAEDMALPYVSSKTRTRKDGTKIPSALTKFKTGTYNVSTKSTPTKKGTPINVNQNMKNSAFEKQLQKAQKNPNNKKNQQFLKKFKNATRPT